MSDYSDCIKIEVILAWSSGSWETCTLEVPSIFAGSSDAAIEWLTAKGAFEAMSDLAYAGVYWWGESSES